MSSSRSHEYCRKLLQRAAVNLEGLCSHTGVKGGLAGGGTLRWGVTLMVWKNHIEISHKSLCIVSFSRFYFVYRLWSADLYCSLCISPTEFNRIEAAASICYKRSSLICIITLNTYMSATLDVTQHRPHTSQPALHCSHTVHHHNL